jgi:polar amino acid transport system substrate-binding protein
MKVLPIARRGPRAAVAWIAGLAAAAMLTGCSGDDAPSVRTAGTTTLERAQQAKKIRVGYANEAPFAYVDPASGRLTGEAPEIARIVLADLGITEVEGVLTEFGSLIPGLQARRFDIIAAGMYVLPERCNEIAFSNPTYSVGTAFVVRAGNPKRLHGYEDLARQPDATLGVVAGAVERSYARGAGIPDKRVMVFPDAPSALEGVAAGRVDAYAGTSLTVNDLLARAKSPRVERATPFTDPVIEDKPVRGYGAFGFRKADVDLVEAFNRGLARLIGSRYHLDVVGAFGFTDRELPGEATAEALCEN